MALLDGLDDSPGHRREVREAAIARFLSDEFGNVCLQLILVDVLCLCGCENPLLRHLLLFPQAKRDRHLPVTFHRSPIFHRRAKF